MADLKVEKENGSCVNTHTHCGRIFYSFPSKVCTVRIMKNLGQSVFRSLSCLRQMFGVFFTHTRTHACSQSVTGLYENLKLSPSTLFQFTESTLASLTRYVFYILAYLSLSEAALIDFKSHIGKIGMSRIAGCHKA